MNKPRHFLSLLDLSSEEFRTLIKRAIELKNMQHNGEIFEPLKNRVLAMIFEKASTRTRVSLKLAWFSLVVMLCFCLREIHS